MKTSKVALAVRVYYGGGGINYSASNQSIRAAKAAVIYAFAALLAFNPAQLVCADALFSWDAERFRFTTESITEEDGYFPLEIGIVSDFEGSGAIYFEDGAVNGAFEEWIRAQVRGDIGAHVSYFFELGVGNLSAERRAGHRVGDVAAYFPWSYRGNWDGFIFPLNDLNSGGPTGWADTPSIGFSLLCEISGGAFDNKILWSLGRKQREWAAMNQGSSLVLNEFAQPFFGGEISFRPFKSFAFSSLTGILEYFCADGIKESSKTFQNAFSISMFEINIKDVFHIDAGTTSIWPKRFELAYLFPLIDKMLYQNNIGDFDNVGFFANLKFTKPGLCSVWASVFIDEMNFEKDFFILDREMFAWQFGLKMPLPALPFASLDVSYTKIEPYCYTHQKIKTPWYDAPVEEAYVNHGYGLGYYLPPNSDEVKMRFQMMTQKSTKINAQFSLVRHGAEYGDMLVDGSSYNSELPGEERSENPVLKKHFLNDGVYQWVYTLKGGVTHRLTKLPIEFSLEGGVVFSYWTSIDGNTNDGSAHSFYYIDTEEYPRQTGFIMRLGIHFFR